MFTKNLRLNNPKMFLYDDFMKDESNSKELLDEFPEMLYLRNVNLNGFKMYCYLNSIPIITEDLSNKNDVVGDIVSVPPKLLQKLVNYYLKKGLFLKPITISGIGTVYTLVYSKPKLIEAPNFREVISGNWSIYKRAKLTNL